jgi:hypothetical protein
MQVLGTVEALGISIVTVDIGVPGSKAHWAKSGFDHGIGHPLLLVCDTKAPNC